MVPRKVNKLLKRGIHLAQINNNDNDNDDDDVHIRKVEYTTFPVIIIVLVRLFDFEIKAIEGK